MKGYLQSEREEAAWPVTFEHLKARYGAERAQLILDGKDDDANADLAKWRALGQPRRKGVG